MRKILMLLCLFSLNITCFCQNNIIPKQFLSEIEINSSKCKLSYLTLSLALKVNRETDAIVYGSFLDMVDVLSSHLDTLNQTHKNYEFLLNNKKMFSAMMNNAYYGGMRDALFLITKNDFPISMLKYKNNSNMLFLTNIIYPNVLNTLKLTSRERASQIVSTFALPCMKEICGYGIKPEIKYMCVGIIYGAMDFSDSSLTSQKGEVLYMISNVNDIKKYQEAELTEDEIIEKSEYFMNDRDGSSVKKIKVEVM